MVSLGIESEIQCDVLNHREEKGNCTLAGCGLGASDSRTGSQLEYFVRCSLNGPSNVAMMSENLNAQIAEPRKLFLKHKISQS